MALASTSVHMVEGAPGNGCCQSVSPGWAPVASCLFERLSTIQAPFKLLLLPWVLELVRFYVHSLRMKSVSHSPLGQMNISPTGLQSQRFSRLIFLVQNLELRSTVWSSDPLLLGENFCNCNYFPLCGSSTQGMGLNWAMTPSFLPMSWGSFLYL